MKRSGIAMFMVTNAARDTSVIVQREEVPTFVVGGAAMPVISF
jgi:hypothetical protein